MKFRHKNNGFHDEKANLPKSKRLSSQLRIKLIFSILFFKITFMPKKSHVI